MAVETTGPPATTSAPTGRTPAPGAVAARVAATGAVLVVWALSLPRMVPSTFGDHGTFVSVAERLLAGDRLYVDVWDNKDPLFYWLLALGRFVSPLSDIALEVLWVLTACLATMLVARSIGASRLLAAVAGFAGVPLLLTGPAYEPGMTHLPGVALTLAAVAAAMRRRWVVAGLLVALIAFTKAILAPAAAVAVVVVAVHRRSWAGLFRSVLAGAVAAAAGVLTLQLRGELGGWIDSYANNVEYAGGDLSSSRYGQVVGHLLRAFPEDGRGAGLVTIAAILLVLLLVGRSRWVAPPTGSADVSGPSDGDCAASPAVVWDLAVATLVTALCVIALTGTFPHHVQAFAVPASLALALVAARLASTAGATGGWRAVLRMVATAYVVAGVLHPYYWLESGRTVGDRVASLRAVSPESEQLRQLPQVHTYARAGTNDVRAHAVGLRAVTLVCPRFHQYSLDARGELEATLACLPTADALIVDDSLVPEAGQPAWNAYVARVRSLVSTGYQCLDAPQAQVCVKGPPGT